MFKLEEIKELIKLIDEASVHELEIESEGTRLAIRKASTTENVIVTQSPAVQQIPQTAVANVGAPQTSGGNAPVADTADSASAGLDPQLHQIISPMVGTFYAAPSPDSPPYVKVGDQLNPTTIVCIVEAMKLMNEIEAEVNGEIVEVLVENGQLVEFGQPLFLVKQH